MSWSNFHYVNAAFLFSDWHSLTLLCFLSFFHSFFLPVAWAVDLAVQGCKYHCGLVHKCPWTFTPAHLYIHEPVLMHQDMMCIHFEMLGHPLHDWSHFILATNHHLCISLFGVNLHMHIHHLCLNCFNDNLISGCHSPGHTWQLL